MRVVFVVTSILLGSGGMTGHQGIALVWRADSLYTAV